MCPNARSYSPLMFAAEKVGVALITDDPMVEIAIRHLFGGEHYGFELSLAMGFQALDQNVPLTGVRILLIDISDLGQAHRISSFRALNPAVSLLYWCSAPVMDAKELLRRQGDGVVSRLASSFDLLAALANISNVSGISGTEGRAREVKVNLTYRESQLVALLAHGYPNKEIAACLGISTGTVKVYLSTLFKKTGARDRFELALLGMKNSLYGRAEMSSPVPGPIAARRAISRPGITSMRLLQSTGDHR